MINLLLAIIYMAFISLGLPDAILGSVWPTMYLEFNVPISYAGIISFIIALGTIISSLQSDRLTKKLGAGLVTSISVGLTAFALLGFSLSHSFIFLCVFAIPYGLGAGSVDAALNNYVALHFESRHMSWLHCMWGVGASMGPYIMGFALTNQSSWNAGYMYVFIIQAVLTLFLFLSLPLWKKHSTLSNCNITTTDEHSIDTTKPIPLKTLITIPGAKQVLIMFFCYCAIEQTAGLWASSYLVLHRGVSIDQATGWASLYFIGITIGRAICGFITMKLSNKQMIRLGEFIIAMGLIIMILPFSNGFAIIGLIIIGLGCAPVYPCVIHSTPTNFGVENSQALTGVQMASAYVGTLIMPPLFGLIANYISISLYPFYLFGILILMVIMYEAMIKKIHNFHCPKQ